MAETEPLHYIHVGANKPKYLDAEQIIAMHYCKVCNGRYTNAHEVIHSGKDAHPLESSVVKICACALCQHKSGRYPDEGFFLSLIHI